MVDAVAGGWRRWRVGVALAVVVLSFTLPAAVIEQTYSRGLFPWIQGLLVPATGAVPFPLLLVVLVALPFGLTWFGIRRWRRGRRAGVSQRRLWWAGGLRSLRWSLYLAAVFLLVWGLGYRRTPIETRWRLAGPAPTPAQIREVQARLLALIHRDCPTGAFDTDRAWQAIRQSAAALAMRMEGFTPATPRHVKHPPTGSLLALGIFGVVAPFTLEANVDAALPAPIRVGISAHELAHLLGYCGEADANLFGFVAGLTAADRAARYGTALSLLRYATAPGDRRTADWLLRNLPARARADLRALRAARQQHRVESLARVSHAMNDRYLRTVGVEHGVDDYARGFALFVRAWRQGLVTLPPPFASPTDSPAGKK